MTSNPISITLTTIYIYATNYLFFESKIQNQKREKTLVLEYQRMNFKKRKKGEKK